MKFAKDLDEPLMDLSDSEDEANQPFVFSWKKFGSFMGPGLLMSIAYLDPGNIAACLQSGTQGKYDLIWTLLLATIIGLCYQTMAARVGVVTQRNLAKLSAQ